MKDRDIYPCPFFTPYPFNPETWLLFHLAKDAPVTISIYNAKGQVVRIISLGNKNAKLDF